MLTKSVFLFYCWMLYWHLFYHFLSESAFWHFLVNKRILIRSTGRKRLLSDCCVQIAKGLVCLRWECERIRNRHVYNGGNSNVAQTDNKGVNAIDCTSRPESLPVHIFALVFNRYRLYPNNNVPHATWAPNRLRADPPIMSRSAVPLPKLFMQQRNYHARLYKRPGRKCHEVIDRHH